MTTNLAESSVRPFVFQGRRFNVHTIVLESELPYFAAATNPAWKHMEGEEIGTETFSLTDPNAIVPMSANDLGALIAWAYARNTNNLLRYKPDVAYWNRVATVVNSANLLHDLDLHAKRTVTGRIQRHARSMRTVLMYAVKAAKGVNWASLLPNFAAAVLTVMLVIAALASVIYRLMLAVFVASAIIGTVIFFSTATENAERARPWIEHGQFVVGRVLLAIERMHEADVRAETQKLEMMLAFVRSMERSTNTSRDMIFAMPDGDLKWAAIRAYLEDSIALHKMITEGRRSNVEAKLSALIYIISRALDTAYDLVVKPFNLVVRAAPHNPRRSRRART